ncbi:hypothetical protein [Kibdelosporangium aridum]|uniref:Uncharacterized protein n=1 Tax=Kibdelosporangium aridum TaxID=2030 RepID=A0A1W2FM50_KIBAR|nr:hypothetical protein [Kibdelosporangium aridum]SMD23015.1 hypothetical protein SAMN05661093_07796 [Kibdelosporangium aridum]
MGMLTEAKGQATGSHMIAIMAIMCMYGMYVWASGGKKESEERMIKRLDGSFEHTVKVEWHAPTGPLGALVRLFRRG